jgi:membrane protein DedA with SNARE-associated domain
MQLLALFDYFNVQHVQVWLEAGGYTLLFGLLFACGLGLPLPEDIPLLLAGFAVAQGKMHIIPAAICAWCGIIGGDCMLYRFGWKYGGHITRVPFVGRHLTAKRVEMAARLYRKYGIWVVAIGRLFAFIRGAMVVAAGVIRYNFVKFFIADGLAALVSGGMFIALGWWGGRKLGNPADVARKAEPYKFWFFVILSAVVIVVIAVLWLRHRRRGEQREVIVLPASPAADAGSPSK